MCKMKHEIVNISKKRNYQEIETARLTSSFWEKQLTSIDGVKQQDGPDVHAFLHADGGPLTHRSGGGGEGGAGKSPVALIFGEQ